MTGWLIFAVLAILLFGLLCWPVRLGRPALMLVAAALFAAAAGYAWQGSPGMPGAPAESRAHAMRGDTLFATERLRFLNHYGETGMVLATADAFNRTGQDEAAVGLLRNSVLKHPADVDLRIGYAHALFVLAKGNLTPAVNLAFDRAAAVAKPGDPVVAYFRSLADLESGDAAAAEQGWQAIYVGLPTGSPWRVPLAQRLAAFAAIRAIEARQAGVGASSPHTTP